MARKVSVHEAGNQVVTTGGGHELESGIIAPQQAVVVRAGYEDADVGFCDSEFGLEHGFLELDGVFGQGDWFFEERSAGAPDEFDEVGPKDISGSLVRLLEEGRDEAAVEAPERAVAVAGFILGKVEMFVNGLCAVDGPLVRSEVGAGVIPVEDLLTDEGDSGVRVEVFVGEVN
jgi:hypothetical protein